MLQRDLPGHPDDRQRRAAASLAKAQRCRDTADDLRQHLPGQLTTPDEYRRYAVWWATQERGWEAYKDAMEDLFGPLEDLDQAAALAAARSGQLDELGRRVHQFVAFCDAEIAPWLGRLEDGLKLLEGDPTHPQRERYLAAIAGMRQKVRAALPHAWLLAAPAAHLYKLLDDEHRAEAERLWGPLAGTDPGDFAPLWRTHFPQARLNALDLRLKEIADG